MQRMRGREMRAPWPLRGKDKAGACFGGRGAGGLRAGKRRSRVLDARAVPESGPGRDPGGGRCAGGPRAKRTCQVSAPLSPAAAPPRPRGCRRLGRQRSRTKSKRGSAAPGGAASSSGVRAGCFEGPRAGLVISPLPALQTTVPSPAHREPWPPSPLPPSRAGLRNVLAFPRSSKDAFGNSVLRAV